MLLIHFRVPVFLCWILMVSSIDRSILDFVSNIYIVCYLNHEPLYTLQTQLFPCFSPFSIFFYPCLIIILSWRFLYCADPFVGPCLRDWLVLLPHHWGFENISATFVDPNYEFNRSPYPICLPYPHQLFSIFAMP